MSSNNPDNEEQVEVIDEDYNEEEINLDDMVELTMDEFEELMNEDEEEEKKDDALLTIDNHDGAVFAVDSYDTLLATGGEDDKAFVWSITSEKPEMKFETEKFSDSVTFLKFSCDGKYLALSDMSGKIRVYLVSTFELFWSYDVETDMESMSWHPSCNVLFCGTNEGQFIMFKISTNEVKYMFNGDNTSLSCFQVLKDGKQAACCYNNGNIRIWDLKSGQPVFNLVKAHEEDIICIDVSADGKLIATGGIDMKINIITPANGKIVWKFSIAGPKPADITEDNNDDNNNLIENSIESVGFCKTMPIIACCTLNGQIITWDVNTHAIRHKITYTNGFSKLIWDEGVKLFAASLDGTIQEWDGRSLELIKKFEGHQSDILDICLNKKFLCTASNDQSVKIFEIQ